MQCILIVDLAFICVNAIFIKLSILIDFFKKILMLQLAPGVLKQRLTQPGVYFFVALWVGQGVFAKSKD
jgi:hypothetical protein